MKFRLKHRLFYFGFFRNTRKKPSLIRHFRFEVYWHPGYELKVQGSLWWWQAGFATRNLRALRRHQRKVANRMLGEAMLDAVGEPTWREIRKAQQRRKK